GPVRGAERLAALVDAHRYSDGFSILDPGTPTNNSADERAGYASRDRRAESSFALEWSDPAPALGPGSAGALLETALGLTAERVGTTFARVAGAAGQEEALAEALQT